MAEKPQPKALVVEDEADVRTLLVDTLSLRDYQCIGVGSGGEAARQVKDGCPELVLLDVGLPDMSGLEVLANIKQACPRTAVVIVTARTALDVAVAALNAGADGYVTKPFLIDELLAVIDRARERQRLLAELERLAITDGLTGLYNRRYFEDKLREEENRAERYGTPVTVVMTDVNHLKYVNDHYGHREGDALLRAAARLLRENTRSVDTVARYGGDEIAIIMPETTQHEASHFLRRLRRAVEKYNEGARVPVSIAVGFASRPPCPTLAIALRLADERMYEDKMRQRAKQEHKKTEIAGEQKEESKREIA